MAIDVVGTGGSSERVAALVDTYARDIYPAVLDQHSGASVSSPLGVWLLLAACATAARGPDRVALEETLGCPTGEAAALLQSIVDSPPPALEAAMAVWTAAADVTSELTEWVRDLPRSVESGAMPTQAQADAWASERTLGLINAFPISVDATTRLVLASALATKVSWSFRFDVVPADEHLGRASLWRGRVRRLLWDSHPGRRAAIVATEAAGTVAVHQAVAEEDLTVISVSAAPEIERERVLSAANEVSAFARHGAPLPTESLFTLALGSGHSWEIAEHLVRVHEAGARSERMAGASLPAWSLNSELDLLGSERFGVGPAVAAVRRLIGSGPGDRSEAKQVAVASFKRYGFEAAAITAVGVASAMLRRPDHKGLERTAVLRFDHPYAAIALAGRPASHRALDRRSPFAGLPLFTAWVEQPREPEDRPPSPSPTDTEEQL